MIVETHCHIISEDQRKYPRQTGPKPAAWIRDLSAEEFLKLMLGAGVDRAILVQAFGAYKCDNRYVADAAARYPDRFVAVFIIDPLRPDACATLEDGMALGLAGMRLVTWTDPPTLLDDARINPLWKRAAELKIPVCVLTTFDQVPRLGAVAARFPELRLALDHLGLPSLSSGPVRGLAPALFELARFPNVYGKFSSWTIGSLTRNSESACAEFFRRLVDAFGPRRLM